MNNKKHVWRLISSGNHNGYYNMAVDEAIAVAFREGRVPSTLRFYTWDPPCISIGYFQKTDGEIMDAGYKPGIVRRITGGRAVYHGGDLSYSVVSGKESMLFPDNVKGTYNIITNALIAGIRNLGINPDHDEDKHLTIDRSTRYHKKLLCFDTTLGHEITVHGKKLIGSAQRRWRDVFLQHGSILVDGTFPDNGHSAISLRECLTGETGFPLLEKGGEGGFEKAFSVEYTILAEYISAGFAETLGITLVKGELTDYETDMAEQLAADKYSAL